MDAMERETGQGEQRFINPISETEDDTQRVSARDFDDVDNAVDPTKEANPTETEGKKKLRVPKHKEIVRENLLDEAGEKEGQAHDMNPVTLCANCWGSWKVMTCAERMEAIKTVSGRSESCRFRKNHANVVVLVCLCHRSECHSVFPAWQSCRRLSFRASCHAIRDWASYDSEQQVLQHQGLPGTCHHQYHLCSGHIHCFWILQTLCHRECRHTSCCSNGAQPWPHNVRCQLICIHLSIKAIRS